MKPKRIKDERKGHSILKPILKTPFVLFHEALLLFVLVFIMLPIGAFLALLSIFVEDDETMARESWGERE